MSQKECSLKKKITKEVRLDYLVFLPASYAKTKKKWPLILFLHGSGERGHDLSLVKKHGVAKIVEGRPKFPFVVVSPQCPEGEWWQADALMALLDEVERKYRIDPSRIYVTGLSMGGFGTWELAARLPDRLAAIVPICGGGIPNSTYLFRHMPTWVFHGAKDEAVLVEEAHRMVAAMKKRGGNPRLTIYPEAGHDSWTETYENEELYKWLLEQRRGRK